MAMKPLTKNTKTYFWANHLFCRKCGGTNKYFHRMWYTHKGVRKFCVLRECRDCYLERQKVAGKKHRESEHGKAWRRAYVAGRIERHRKQDVVRQTRARKRRRESKKMAELQMLMDGRVLV